MIRIGGGASFAAAMADACSIWQDLPKMVQANPLPAERYGKTGAARIKRKAKKRKNVKARSAK